MVTEYGKLTRLFQIIIIPHCIKHKHTGHFSAFTAYTATWYNILEILEVTNKTIATNRKAYHNYHILDKFEAGIVLTGTEIKSIRAGRVNLGQAFVKPEGGEIWLINAHIARYEAGSYMSHEPTRTRKLLLNRREIRNLISKTSEKGSTLVPLSLYLKGHIAKVEIALAKGKKQYDKRETIQQRDAEREMDRTIKSRKR